MTQTSQPVPWEEAARITDLPAVDETIQAFSADPTGDNAVGMVQAILQAALSQQAAAEPVVNVPPSSWDEWAMHRSRNLVQEMEDVSHPRAQLVARLHCLLIDAMQFAAPVQPVQQEAQENCNG